MKEPEYLWDPTAPADPEIAELEAALRRYRMADTLSDVPESHRNGQERGRAARRPHLGMIPWAGVRWAVAAAAAFAAVIGAYEVTRRSLRPWSIDTIAGTPRIDGEPVDIRSRLGGGQWIQTDSLSVAKLKVGHIGYAEIGPDSRVQLVRTAGAEHRLALHRGRLHARIWAPPRFFLVETAGALAVDLGCVYTLAADSLGFGTLQVESGEVELVRGQYRVLVPAGNEARLRGVDGPGLPVPSSAGATYRELVAAVDATDQPDSAVVHALIDASDSRHSITLWHLMARLEGGLRQRAVDALLRTAPPPDGVTRSQLIAGDPDALARWQRLMAGSWTSEDVPAWKSLWRRLWLR